MRRGRYESGFIVSLDNKTDLALADKNGVNRSAVSLVRSTTDTVVDFEGNIRNCKSGETRFAGARRVENRFTADINSPTGYYGTGTITLGQIDADGSNNAIAVNMPTIYTGAYFNLTQIVNSTDVASIYIKADVAGEIKFFDGNGNGFGRILNVTTTWKRFSSGPSIKSANNQVQFAIYRNSLAQLDKVYIYKPQYETISGQSNQSPSEYLTGVKYFDYLNGNTVDVYGVVTEANGALIPESTIKGVLIEPTATNYLTYRDDLRNTADAGSTRPWAYDGISNVSQTTLTIGAINYPVNILTETNTLGVHAVSPYPYTTYDNSIKAAFSVIAKAKERSKIYLITFPRNPNGSITSIAWFDLQTGLVLSTSNANAEITALPDGFYLCTIYNTVTASGTQLDCRLGTTNADGIQSYQGDGSSGIYIVDTQLEKYFATSRISTGSTTVTRNADIETIPTAKWNIRHGRLSFKFTPTHNSIGTVALGGSYVDANNYTQLLHTSGTGYIFRKRIAGTNYDTALSGEFVKDTTYDIEIVWSDSSGTDVYINGIKGVNNPNTLPFQLGSTWQVGGDGNSLNQAGGSFKNIKVRSR